MKKTYTAEYVSAKHPDKMCDRISDAILLKFNEQDPNSRVAVETLGGHGHIYIVGEVTSHGTITQQNYKSIVADITGKRNSNVTIHIVQQSSEIAQGVDNGGAGDQGIVIGYACNHNSEMIPQEFYLAKSLCNYLYEIYPYDGKTQITINEKHEIDVIASSFQNSKTDELQKHVLDWVFKNNIALVPDIRYLLNPAGEWSIGGFDADTGLTGRKIVIDSYGPRVPIGGGAFSGKDWTKVDRSGAEYAKHIAQTLLIKHKATEVRVELAYAIGINSAIQSIAYIDNAPTNISNFDTSMVGIHNYIRNKSNI